MVAPLGAPLGRPPERCPTCGATGTLKHHWWALGRDSIAYSCNACGHQFTKAFFDRHPQFKMMRPKRSSRRRRGWR